MEMMFATVKPGPCNLLWGPPCILSLSFCGGLESASWWHTKWKDPESLNDYMEQSTALASSVLMTVALDHYVKPLRFCSLSITAASVNYPD